MTVFIALLSCSSKTREGRKSERSVSHAKKLQLTAKSKQSPLKRPPQKAPTHQFSSEECCGPAKGTGLIDSPLHHVKTQSLLSDGCADTGMEADWVLLHPSARRR